MPPDQDLQAVRGRLRTAWATRRVYGLAGVAMALRVERLIALESAGRIPHAGAVRMALEAEAVALCVRPLPLP